VRSIRASTLDATREYFSQMVEAMPAARSGQMRMTRPRDDTPPPAAAASAAHAMPSASPPSAGVPRAPIVASDSSLRASRQVEFGSASLMASMSRPASDSPSPDARPTKRQKQEHTSHTKHGDTSAHKQQQPQNEGGEDDIVSGASRTPTRVVFGCSSTDAMHCG
jgi:hypothetical protein